MLRIAGMARPSSSAMVSAMNSSAVRASRFSLPSSSAGKSEMFPVTMPEPEF